MRSTVRRSAVVYIIATTALAVVTALALWRSGEAAASVPLFVIVCALGMLAHAHPIRGFRYQAYQVTLPFIVLAAATFNAWQLTAFIIAIHIAEQARLRRRVYIQWFNTCNYLASAAVGAILYQRAIAALPSGALGLLIAALATACAFILLNRLLLAGALWLGRQLSPLASGLFRPELLAADLIIAWISGPMLVLALEAGPWTIVVAAGPLLLARPALSALLRREESTVRIEAPAA